MVSCRKMSPTFITSSGSWLFPCDFAHRSVSHQMRGLVGRDNHVCDHACNQDTALRPPNPINPTRKTALRARLLHRSRSSSPLSRKCPISTVGGSQLCLNLNRYPELKRDPRFAKVRMFGPPFSVHKSNALIARMVALTGPHTAFQENPPRRFCNHRRRVNRRQR